MLLRQGKHLLLCFSWSLEDTGLLSSIPSFCKMMRGFVLTNTPPPPLLLIHHVSFIENLSQGLLLEVNAFSTFLVRNSESTFCFER